MAYDKSFYEEQSLGSRNSAKEVIPFLLNHFNIKSVVDLGCGLGTWLSIFEQHGITDIAGYDGDYVPREYLQIPQEAFHPVDLSTEIEFGRRYDLSMSLEVAEHISPLKAREFVGKLTSLSDIVMFSSAFPYQGGTGHVNENYPEYWALIFKEFGYTPIDIIRDNFWYNGMVCPWYRQNILIFIKEEVRAEKYPAIPTAVDKILTRIHPEMYLWCCVRPDKTQFAPHQFEDDKCAFYPVIDAWRYHSTMPENVRSYGTEYNIEYSAMPWWKKLKLKLAYYSNKRKEK